MRLVPGVVEDLVVSHDAVRVLSDRLSRIRVDVETRKIRAGDIHADAMTGLEEVARGFEDDLEGVDCAPARAVSLCRNGRGNGRGRCLP